MEQSALVEDRGTNDVKQTKDDGELAESKEKMLGLSIEDRLGGSDASNSSRACLFRYTFRATKIAMAVTSETAIQR